MSRASRFAACVVLLIALLVCAVASSFALSELAVSRSQHQWCDALQVLTSAPVAAPGNPAKNVSREGQYRLYEDFLHVREQFGCRAGH